VVLLLKIEELEDVVDFWKSRGYAISNFRTSGGIHDGHIGFYRMLQVYCDRIVVFFVHYTRYLDLSHGRNYESLFEDDCKKFDGIARYVAIVKYTKEVEALYREYKEKCKNIDWDKYILNGNSNFIFKAYFTNLSMPLPFEKTLYKFDFVASSEKEVYIAPISEKISREVYDDKTPRRMYFPVIRRDDGTPFDSRDEKLDRSNRVEFTNTVLKEVKSLIKEDLSQEEIFKKIGQKELSQEERIKLVKEKKFISGIEEIKFLSAKDVRVVERPSKCVAGTFLTSKGVYDCNVLSISYVNSGLSYTECFLFDDLGRFVLNDV